MPCGVVPDECIKLPCLVGKVFDKVPEEVDHAKERLERLPRRGWLRLEDRCRLVLARGDAIDGKGVPQVLRARLQEGGLADVDLEVVLGKSCQDFFESINAVLFGFTVYEDIVYIH